MAGWIIAVIIYFMIGLFFAELFHEPGVPGSDFTLILIPLWPVMIVICVLGLIVVIPSKLAIWVKSKF